MAVTLSLRPVLSYLLCRQSVTTSKLPSCELCQLSQDSLTVQKKTKKKIVERIKERKDMEKLWVCMCPCVGVGKRERKSVCVLACVLVCMCVYVRVCMCTCVHARHCAKLWRSWFYDLFTLADFIGRRSLSKQKTKLESGWSDKYEPRANFLSSCSPSASPSFLGTCKKTMAPTMQLQAYFLLRAESHHSL